MEASFQLALGISRNLRNSNENLGYSCGVFYGGIILLDYTWNVLRKSQEIGFETLYFIARDGYIPKMIADFLVEKFKLKIKTKYLYISMKSIGDAFDFPEKRNIVNEYLNQEINKNEKFAFVDIGGAGGTVNSIGHLIGMNNVYEFLLHSFLPNLHRYYGKEIIIKIILQSSYIVYNRSLIEVLSTAPHARTIGYERKENKIIPILHENNLAELYPAYNDFVKGTMDFTHAYAEYIVHYPIADLASVVMNNILKYEDYWDFFGNMPHEIFEKFSSRLSLIEILDLSLLNIRNSFVFTPYSYEKRKWYKNVFNISNKLKGTLFADIYKFSRIAFAKINNRSRNLFPSWNRNLFGKKIVLYGAGELGKQWHSTIQIYNMCKIILWADKKKNNINKIPKLEFDYVLIAIRKIEIMEEVIKELVSMGIPKGKIRSLNGTVNLKEVRHQ
jgi:hypothetical protein